MLDFIYSLSLICFWGSILLIVYAYFGYALFLCLIGIVRDKEVAHRSIYPHVTMIITAHNEEKRIAEKLTNTLALAYPRDKLQIIVASDGSTDKTDKIVEGFKDDDVQLVRVVERRGKENAQKEALWQARGDVVVFSDVGTILDQEGLEEIVSNFADNSVGCVSSEDRLIGKDGSAGGEGSYVRYEMWLRKLESRVGSLVGLSGSLFAIRREIGSDFPGDLQSDFYVALKSVSMGYRAVSSPAVKGHYRDVKDEAKEFDRKVRTVVRGLTVFFRNLTFLNLFRYGFFSVQFLSHKLMRWLVPFFLMVSFVTSLFLSLNSMSYFAFWGIQAVFYLLALLGYFFPISKKIFFVRIPFYFSLVNVSILVAWLQFIAGKRIVMWEPSKR
jgi:glycosyltransferase involved in cell wall biosynthesis